MKIRNKRLLVSVVMLMVSAMLLTTASFAWFAMNTSVNAGGVEVEAYSDSFFLEIATEDTDSAYETETTFGDVKQQLRLITYGFVSATNPAMTIDVTPGSGYFAAGDSNTYYVIADSDVGGAATPAHHNYVKITPEEGSDLSAYYENPTFELKTSGKFTTGDSNVYCMKINEGCYEQVTLADGDSLKGYYLATGVTTYATGKYAGSNVYYELRGKQYHNVTDNLSQGTDLGECFTIVAADASGEKFDGTSYYYVKQGDDFVCIGAPTADTEINNYLYFGRAYSSDPLIVDETQTLNVIGDAVAANYYFADTLYIRQAEGTNNASNFRVSNIEVGNADADITAALRVLLVAKSTTGEYVTCIYDAGEDKFYESNDFKANGAAGTAEDEFTLFDTLLGDMAETVTVDVYVFFDGIDENASNQIDIENGQTVSIEFAIDEHDYNAFDKQ